MVRFRTHSSTPRSCLDLAAASRHGVKTQSLLLALTHIILVRGVLSGLVGQVSCTQEVAATPLLDLQSAKFKGYFPGLVQVIIRDYLAADALKPHYGAGTPTVVAVCENVFRRHFL